jgi:hypothetical protein
LYRLFEPFCVAVIVREMYKIHRFKPRKVVSFEKLNQSFKAHMVFCYALGEVCVNNAVADALPQFVLAVVTLRYNVGQPGKRVFDIGGIAEIN